VGAVVSALRVCIAIIEIRIAITTEAATAAAINNQRRDAAGALTETGSEAECRSRKAAMSDASTLPGACS
jgi:hypothetical protein